MPLLATYIPVIVYRLLLGYFVYRTLPSHCHFIQDINGPATITPAGFPATTYAKSSDLYTYAHIYFIHNQCIREYTQSYEYVWSIYLKGFLKYLWIQERNWRYYRHWHTGQVGSITHNTQLFVLLWELHASVQPIARKRYDNSSFYWPSRNAKF